MVIFFFLLPVKFSFLIRPLRPRFFLILLLLLLSVLPYLRRTAILFYFILYHLTFPLLWFLKQPQHFPPVSFFASSSTGFDEPCFVEVWTVAQRPQSIASLPSSYLYPLGGRAPLLGETGRKRFNWLFACDALSDSIVTSVAALNR